MTVLHFYIALSVLIFFIGVLGFITRRSGIVALMCLELMLNGVNLALVTFSKMHGNPEGNALVLFVVLVAAAEAAVALSLLVVLYRRLGSISLEDYRSLKG